MFEKIIKGCRKRRRDSQRELYKMFYGYGMSITLRYASSRDEGVLILNDAFMKVFTNIKKYDTDRPFKPWFRQIVINTAINHFHKTRAKNKRAEVELQEHHLSKEENIISGINYDEMVGMVQNSRLYTERFSTYM